jgi:hypothetical protein
VLQRLPRRLPGGRGVSLHCTNAMAAQVSWQEASVVSASSVTSTNLVMHCCTCHGASRRCGHQHEIVVDRGAQATVDNSACAAQCAQRYAPYHVRRGCREVRSETVQSCTLAGRKVQSATWHLVWHNHGWAIACGGKPQVTCPSLAHLEGSSHCGLHVLYPQARAVWVGAVTPGQL